MSKIEKLIHKLLSNPKNFTFDELSKILTYFGFKISNKGKTSGSRVKFIHKDKNIAIILHKPHPKPILKGYAIKQIIEELKKYNLL